MTHDEIMHLINRSLFAEIGYTDKDGRQNIRKVFCVWHKGLGRHLISTNTGSGHVQSLLQDPDAYDAGRTYENGYAGLKE